MDRRVAIVGAGLCGNLLAILLAQQGLEVTVYERGPAPGESNAPAGRSINLALAARGIRALDRAGVLDAVDSLLLPMPGRIVHAPGGARRFLPYGQHANERIWSVSRDDFNRALVRIAQSRHEVRYRFEHTCVEVDAERIAATIRSPGGDRSIEPGLLIAADGAGSTVRRQLAAARAVEASEELLDHGYKELTIPATEGGDFALTAEGLHIWPRGGFMLIALPNIDRTFTATLFLPARGRPGFDTLPDDEVGAFFAAQFPDVAELMPDLETEFAARPVGVLGTVHCRPWSVTGKDSARSILLIGDAAHAIVPFHGQGMNAAFEDCVELARLVSEAAPGFGGTCERFEAARRDNTRAIAEMALENYEEMRDSVRDRRFEQRMALAFRLEQRFPGRFIPRYSMVMFHPEIGYAEAQRRGRIQAGILDEAMAAGDMDTGLDIASTLVEQRL